MSKKEKLNKEYVDLIVKMRALNKERYEVFKKFKKLVPDVQIHNMNTPSIYFDLFGKDLDDE